MTHRLQAEGPWRELETLLLLEGIQLYGDNWAEIASHVGTKSQVCASAPVFVGVPGGVEGALLILFAAGRLGRGRYCSCSYFPWHSTGNPRLERRVKQAPCVGGGWACCSFTCTAIIGLIVLHTTLTNLAARLSQQPADKHADKHAQIWHCCDPRIPKP